MKHFALRTITKSIFALALLFSTSALFAQDMQMPAPSETVVDVVNNSEDHTILAALLVDTELNTTLSQPGSYTVVAPTDDAFNELGESLETLRQNPQQLQQIVLNHLYQGAASAEEMKEALNIDIISTIDTPDNGVVHVVDQVIMQRN